MRRQGASVALVGLVAVWAAAPLVVLAARAASRDEWFSGADAPTMIDELQYFAWIRDASDHFLASNLFRIGASDHVFADPMFLISAGFHRLGLSVSLAYLIWLPVAVAALALGPFAYARARLGDVRAAAAAAVAGLFFVGPHYLAVHWTGAVPDARLTHAAATLFPAVMLLGGLPFAIALGLVPVALLLAERRRWAGASAVALVVAWIHPWQGEQIALACAGALALRRRESSELGLIAPIAAVALPLGYFAALSHFDSDWHTARIQAHGTDVTVWAWLVVIAPLAALAAAGLRDPRASLGEALLAAWPLACIVAFVVTPSVPAHALIGITIPLAVLAVRGWLRLGWSRVAGAAVAVALFAGATAYAADALHETVTSGLQPYSLVRDDRAALAFLDRAPAPGGVLARTFAGSLVPELTGRQTFVGHGSWTPGFGERAYVTERLLQGNAETGKARAFVRATGARFVVVDCGSHHRVESQLAPLVARITRFGCASVVTLR